MAADEPPYLTIGTDVSAKYKGAFCEAKIKKVNRVVKCKVTFKNNLGAFVVTDDLIKGPLRLGAEVEAKHPEKNQFSEAVINKLQDYSQYTVVFDDGDETTLRRTSLCLKSGRHFAESPTLDQFPLTNPEHFGTPVIGSGKFKRKRRSTVNSSLDYESSDDDSLPRKLKAIRGKERDPDLGKVVCVDYGDRRKKDNWYPGLIVPLPPQSNIKILKEEHLIRSFKDGKYYQVPKRDIREFAKESGQKVENNALRNAVEKATLYLEKEELPPHWDKVLFIGLDDEESNDSESDTSDDEPSEEKDRFVAQLYKFMDERGTPINKAPTVSNRDLNLYKLFKIMHKLGGYNKVTNKNKWKTVYSKMGLPHSVANGPNQVKFAYKRYLQSFEDFYRKLGCTMVNNSRSTRGRHRSDRNIIITRTRDRDTASPKSKNTKESKEKNAVEKKNEEKPKPVDKKENKLDEITKSDEKTKSAEKKKGEDDKRKREERRRVIRKEEEAKPEKARTREDARKEKNDSPEKKGTRSTSKIELDKKEKEETPKEKKVQKEKKEEKPAKEEKPKPKKEDTPVKDRKPVREKKVDEKSNKEKREVPVREKRDLSKEKKEVPKESPKGKKEDPKSSTEEKSPKRKLERAVKKDLSKFKPDESESKEVDKKEEKQPVVEVKEEQVLKKPKLKIDESPSSEEERAVNLEDISILEDKKPRSLRNESEDEPPNKGKRRFTKGDDKDDKESLLGFSDSDESLTNDSEKPSGSKDLKKEIEVGDRVKVKYGRGRMQKVYEAKVLKTETDGIEKRYYVHYAGWNMRYDEWVRKNYIVAIISGNKKFETTKNPLPPSGMKKQERSRFPGAKSVRKNSTSSTNSNVSRSTRSDKRDDSDSKKKSKNYDRNAADTSQESDSERDDDEEGNDADVEDSSALQTDSCFKEELFTDDEERDKLEDVKQGGMTQIEKALEPSEDISGPSCNSIDNKNFELECQKNIMIQNESKEIDSVSFPNLEKAILLNIPSEDDKKSFSKKDVPKVEQLEQSSSLPATTTSNLEIKLPLSETSPKSFSPTPLSDICPASVNKPPTSVLNFSGLIKKSETSNSQDSHMIAPESGFLPVLSSINVDEEPEKKVITNSESESSSNSKLIRPEIGEEHFQGESLFSTVKLEIPPENTAVSPDCVDPVEQKATDPVNETSSSCPGLFSIQKNELKDIFKNSTEDKEPINKNEPEQNVFMPSFSPQNVDQSFLKLSADNHIHSEAVDVSKMIPGILERLKNDVVTEFDSPLPQKNELTFDFLRESSSKCMSRSDSSSSLRICESDTNDSNTDSKDLGFKSSLLPVSENQDEDKSVLKSSLSTVDTNPVALEEELNEETANESKPTVLSEEQSRVQVDKPPDLHEQGSSSKDIEFTSVEEQPLTQEEHLKVKDDDTTASNATNHSKLEEMTVSTQSSVVDSEDTKDMLFKDLIHAEENSFAIGNVIKFETGNENASMNKESSDKDELTSVTNSTNSPKETSDSVSTTGFGLNILSQKGESAEEQNSPSQSDEKNCFDPVDTLKNMPFSLKKEGKKKKFGKKLGKKFGCSEMLDKEDKDLKTGKDGKTKNKKKMKFEGFSGDRARSIDIKSKSKKLKKSKNKKRFKREDSCESFIKKADDDEGKDFDKVKRKEKKKIDKKNFKSVMKTDDVGDSKVDLLKKKKGKKNRDKFLGEKKEFYEKKTKKKRKLHLDNNQDTDSDKDAVPKVEKKRKKKKPKIKDCSSSDDGADKFFIDESVDLPSCSTLKQEFKSDDPDMTFLLCEEKVPASPVDIMDDTSGSSSLEDGSSELPNVNNTSTVMDNTPPTTPSSTESLLSSSPSHERDSFAYPESTQSGRESCEGESDLFRCGSHRTISRGSEEYHAATTLAFAVGQSVSEKPPPPPGDFPKQQKIEPTDHQPSKRKKKSKRFRRISESAKSPKHKSSFLRMPKVDNCYEDSSGTSLAAMSNSPPYGSLNFSRSLPMRLSHSTEDIIYIPLHEKDPEKRIALLQKKMGDLRKEYMALRAEVFAIDHKRRKARKKVKDSAGCIANTSIQSDDGQSCS